MREKGDEDACSVAVVVGFGCGDRSEEVTLRTRGESCPVLTLS